jgi:hypothetical protein
MINARCVARTCLVCTAIVLLPLVCASSTFDQEQFPVVAGTFSQSQAPTGQSPPSQPSAQSQGDQGKTQPTQTGTDQKKNDRMFFVMPNFLTVRNEAQVKPLTWRGKFAITADGAFDPYEFFTAGIVAGIRQAENAYPGFGQGFDGYARRYGTAFADEVDGNMMVGAVFPSILRTDPRYFQKGTGSFSRRLGYALSRVFVTRKDFGGSTFNLSEPLGNGVAAAISNFYYPASDRSIGSSLHGWVLQMGIDGIGNVLKEFWPDIHRRMERRKHADSAAPATTP